MSLQGLDFGTRPLGLGKLPSGGGGDCGAAAGAADGGAWARKARHGTIKRKGCGSGMRLREFVVMSIDIGAVGLVEVQMQLTEQAQLCK